MDDVKNRQIAWNTYEGLRVLLQHPYEGILFIDKNGVVQFVNESFAKYNKRSPESMVGLHYEEFEFDPEIKRVFETQTYLMFQSFSLKTHSYIASRYPVYFEDNTFAGVVARYFSTSSQDVNRKFGDEYANLIERMQIKDIQLELERSIMELNTYRDDYNKEIHPMDGINRIIGDSASVSRLKRNILKISKSPSSVLITGESGTGKELVARAVHFHGDRVSKPFIKVNCTAIPDTLIESELFGYADGAFTGARKGGKMGKFELANNGTIFLDEIGDMPLSMQAKILRALQEREIERVGGETTILINVRVIAATNRDLAAMVAKGQFREDLFYRINIINLHIPPLRERAEDIPAISNHTIRNLNAILKKTVQGIEPETMELLLGYDWPGNIRELTNAIESAMNFCRTQRLKTRDFPLPLHWKNKHPEEETFGMGMQSKIDDAEKSHLVAVLKQCGGSRKDAAAILNVSKSTLYRMMKKFDLIE